jgi:hypothetical protein
MADARRDPLPAYRSTNAEPGFDAVAAWAAYKQHGDVDALVAWLHETADCCEGEPTGDADRFRDVAEYIGSLREKNARLLAASRGAAS